MHITTTIATTTTSTTNLLTATGATALTVWVFSVTAVAALTT